VDGRELEEEVMVVAPPVAGPHQYLNWLWGNCPVLHSPIEVMVDPRMMRYAPAACLPVRVSLVECMLLRIVSDLLLGCALPLPLGSMVTHTCAFVADVLACGTSSTGDAGC
jgi:hypothetical protein